MDPRNDEPFDRTPWRRLLGSDSGAPTQGVDRRILAEARRALMPRVARWWLPASLAASLLLAVLIVQWQLADSGAPAHVTESDVLLAPAPIAADEAAPAADVASPRIDAPSLESRRAPVAEAPAAFGKLRERESYEESRTPEEWYADIEALRAAGRIKEADAELARFKSKYPGWLERHQQQDP
jgi:hypothetical protein